MFLATLLAACSGDEGGAGSAKVRYIEQSDGICRESFPKTSGLTARDQATAEKAEQEWGATAEKLKALPQPQESVELARQFVTDVENISLSYAAAARALAFNDQGKAAKAFDDVTLVKTRVAKTADNYGYEDCRAIGTA